MTKTVFIAVLLTLPLTATYAAVSVPFKASISANLTGPDTEGAFTLTGMGNQLKASHMGKISYSAEGQITGSNTDILIETLVAANGDLIVLRCDQTLTEDPQTGFLIGNDSSTVISGTGRFLNASGTLGGQTIIDLQNHVVRKTIQGNLSY